jgi:hypothetical protein
MGRIEKFGREVVNRLDYSWWSSWKLIIPDDQDENCLIIRINDTSIMIEDLPGVTITLTSSLDTVFHTSSSLLSLTPCLYSSYSFPSLIS